MSSANYFHMTLVHVDPYILLLSCILLHLYLCIPTQKSDRHINVCKTCLQPIILVLKNLDIVRKCWQYFPMYILASVIWWTCMGDTPVWRLGVQLLGCLNRWAEQCSLALNLQNSPGRMQCLCGYTHRSRGITQHDQGGTRNTHLNLYVVTTGSNHGQAGKLLEPKSLNFPAMVFIIWKIRSCITFPKYFCSSHCFVLP